MYPASPILPIPTFGSRVSPEIFATSALLVRVTLLNSVDFPTLGLPIIAIVGLSSILSSLGGNMGGSSSTRSMAHGLQLPGLVMKR